MFQRREVIPDTDPLPASPSRAQLPALAAAAGGFPLHKIQPRVTPSPALCENGLSNTHTAPTNPQPPGEGKAQLFHDKTLSNVTFCPGLGRDPLELREKRIYTPWQKACVWLFKECGTGAIFNPAGQQQM